MDVDIRMALLNRWAPYIRTTVRTGTAPLRIVIGPGIVQSHAYSAATFRLLIYAACTLAAIPSMRFVS